MKKILMFVLMLGMTLSASVSLQAKHGSDMEPAYCPIKVLDHSADLKLNDAQKKQLEQIKEDAMKSFTALKEKVDQDTKAVLNAKQVKKYDELKAKRSSESKCDKCDKKEKCDKCEKKDCEGKSCERPVKKSEK